MVTNIVASQRSMYEIDIDTWTGTLLWGGQPPLFSSGQWTLVPEEESLVYILASQTTALQKRDYLLSDPQQIHTATSFLRSVGWDRTRGRLIVARGNPPDILTMTSGGGLVTVAGELGQAHSLGNARMFSVNQGSGFLYQGDDHIHHWIGTLNPFSAAEVGTVSQNLHGDVDDSAELYYVAKQTTLYRMNYDGTGVEARDLGTIINGLVLVDLTISPS
jgi:hypothetical protein